jgi:hypothetical protein
MMAPSTSFKDTVLFIFEVFFASWVTLSLLYPDLWFYHTSRLLSGHDTLSSLEGTYVLVSHFFHGGVQLWDRFDQMNNAYFVLSNGVYGVAYILTAFVFIIFSPFFDLAGQHLYHMHLFLFYALNCLIRTVGGYLLLRRLVSHPAAFFIGVIYLNTLLTSYMMAPGIITQSLYSLFPLLLYFILCFFEEMRLKSFLLAALVMSLCLANTALFALGYFYQAVHFFIFSCFIFFLFRRGWCGLAGRSRLPEGEMAGNIGLAVCCLLIILPYLWWGCLLLQDFYVHGSGLGATHGRFNNIFNLSGYFNPLGKSRANPMEFLGSSLDYHQLWLGSSWLFMGASSFLLALAGVMLSKDRRKYIFLAATFSVILINTANFFDYSSALWLWIKGGHHLNDFLFSAWLTVSFVAHAINALTNPFSFLVRSFHMTSLLTPMLMLPLMAMGLQSYFCLWQRKADKIHFKRRWWLIVFHALFIFWLLLGDVNTLGIYPGDPNATPVNTGPGLKDYLLCMSSLFLLLLLLPEVISADKRWVQWAVLAGIFVTEFVATKAYVSQQPLDEITPIRVSPTYTRQAMVPDYQNPKILPFREFLSLEKGQLCHEIYTYQGMFGDLYQFVSIGRFFRKWDLYEPRPMAYRDLFPDVEVQEYLIRNPRAMFFADLAFDSRYVRPAQLLYYGLEQRTITVDQDQYNRPFLNTTGKVNVSPLDFKEKFYNISLGFNQAEIKKSPWGWEYSFDLPKDFPFYLSTTVFSKDYTSWELTADNKVLEPMQGVLTAPFTYDVQNIQDKKLTVLLPYEKAPQGDIKLQVKLPDRVLNVWKNTYDDLGFTYEAPKAGWLVFNDPYDQKWELSIDGKKTFVSRVNRYFIGVPISGGQHQVLLRYWPHTTLRLWIFISMVLSVMCFCGIIFYGIKHQPLYGHRITEKEIDAV